MNQDNYQPPSADITPNLAEDNQEADFAAFIGPNNTHYYLERFRRLAEGGSASWHWPAFFVTSFWLLYRKMWLWALFYIIGVPFLTVMLAGVLGIFIGESGGVFAYLAYLLFGILIMPMIANRIYFQRARSKIEKINSVGFEEDRRRRFIESTGGTSLLAAFLIMIVPTVGILAAIAIPAYQDYTIRAQVYDGMNMANSAKVAVARHFESYGSFPADNAEGGLSEPGTISSEFVSSVAVESGIIIVTYGNNAHQMIHDLSIYLYPSGSNGSVEWTCDATEMPLKWTPVACRP